MKSAINGRNRYRILAGNSLLNSLWLHGIQAGGTGGDPRKIPSIFCLNKITNIRKQTIKCFKIKWYNGKLQATPHSPVLRYRQLNPGGFKKNSDKMSTNHGSMFQKSVGRL
jgi:hypothetical protein